jgi:hypothetical protein
MGRAGFLRQHHDVLLARRLLRFPLLGPLASHQRSFN